MRFALLSLFMLAFGFARGFAASGDQSAAQKLPPVVARYEQLLLRSPGKGVPFDKVVQHFLENGGLEALAARWEAQTNATATEPEVAASYWLLRGLLSDRLGRSSDAISALRRATELRPEFASAWQVLGELLTGAGDHAGSAEAYIAGVKAASAPMQKHEMQKALARAQQRAFDLDGAVATWNQILSENQGDPFALEEASDALMEAEQWDAAAKALESLRALAGEDVARKAEATLRLGRIEERKKQPAAARAIYEQVLGMVSETHWLNREARGRIEASFRRADDLPGLAEYYGRWLEKAGKDVEAARRYADVLMDLNRKSDAGKWMKNAAEWAPERVDLRLALAGHLLATNDTAGAVLILRELAERHPEETAFWEQLGEAQWKHFLVSNQAADKAAALESWAKIAPAASRDALAAARLAELLRAHQLSEEALVQYARAASLDTQSPDLRQQWGEYLLALERPDEAWKVLATMTEGGLGTAENWLRLAGLQRRHKQLKLAEESVRKGLEIAPNHFELLATLWRLFAEQSRWPEALALVGRMDAATPNMYFSEQVEDMHLQALRSLEKMESTGQELRKRLVEGDPLSEPEVSLLVEISLRGGDLAAAYDALEDGAKRFAQSVSLVRKRAEYHRRKGEVEARVTALHRLVGLQPAQSTEWLMQIAKAYQEAGMWEQAREAIRVLIAASPASADAHLLAADIETMAQNFSGSVEWLRKAIPHAERPNDVRMRLARAFQEQGQAAEARQMFEEIFENEEDLRARLDLMKPLVEVYQSEGKLEELITRFRQRQKAEEGGWRYALYLAEIFQQQGDPAAAREELAKALGDRAKDANLLRQLVRLAEAEQNTAELVRFRKLLAAVEPSEANQIAHAVALVDHGDPMSAFEILKKHEAQFLADPGTWRDLLLRLHTTGMKSEVRDLLGLLLKSRPEDWKVRMALAELQAGIGDYAGATQLLWQIYEMPSTPGPPPAVSGPLQFQYPTGGWFGMYGTSPMVTRVNRASTSHIQMQQLLNMARSSGQISMMRSRRMTAMGINRAGATAPTGLDQARDNALVYLATLAQQNGQETEFMAALSDHVKDKPRVEQLAAYALSGARAALLDFLNAEASRTTTDAALDEYCAEVVLTFALRPGVEVPRRQLVELFDTFTTRGTLEHHAHRIAIRRYRILQTFDFKDEAAVAGAKVMEMSPTAADDILHVVMAISLERRDLARALEIYRRFRDVVRRGIPQAVTSRQFQLSWYPGSVAQAIGEAPEQAPQGAQLISEMMADVFAAPSTSASSPRPIAPSFNWGDGEVTDTSNLIILPTRHIDDSRMQMLRMVFEPIQANNALPLLNGHLDRIIPTLTRPASIPLRLSRACFRLWSGDATGAVNEVSDLVAETADDELRLLLATWQVQLGRGDEAHKTLKGLQAKAGDLWLGAQFIKMKNGLVHDAYREEGLGAARNIIKSRTRMADPMSFIRQLRQLGLAQEADAFQNQFVSQATSRNPRDRSLVMLNQSVQNRTPADGLTIARTILGRDPSSGGQDENARTQALNAVKQLNALPTYIAELQQQLGSTPRSIKIAWQLAEALSAGDKPEAGPAWQRVAALRPEDAQLKASIARRLDPRKFPAETIALWSGVLEIDPVFAVPHMTFITSAFNQSQRLPDLAKLLIQNGKIAGANAESVLPLIQSVAGALRPRDGDAAMQLLEHFLNAIPEANAMREIVQDYVQLALERERSSAAIRVLERHFFPEENSAKALLFSDERFSNAPRNLAAGGLLTTNVEFPSATLLDLAQRAGALPSLLNLARAKTSTTALHELVFKVVLMARLADPANLPECQKTVEAILADMDAKIGLEDQFPVLLLGRELRKWSPMGETALDVLTLAFNKLAKNQNALPQVRSAIGLETVSLAREFGKKESAQATLKQMVAPEQITAMLDAGMVPPVLDDLADLAMFEELGKAISLIRAHPLMGIDLRTAARLEHLENRMAAAMPDSRLAVAVGVLPPRPGESKRVLIWDFAPTKPGWRVGTVRFSAGASGYRPRDVPALQIMVGDETLVSGQALPMQDARGTAEVYLPTGNWLQVRVQGSGPTGESAVIPFGRGANRVPETLRMLSTSPVHSADPLLALSAYSAPLFFDKPAGEVLKSGPMPLSPREAVLVSAWVWFPEGAKPPILRVKLDGGRNHRLLSAGEALPGHWTYYRVILSARVFIRSREIDIAQILPDNVQTMELEIVSGGQMAVDALYAGSMNDATPTESAPGSVPVSVPSPPAKGSGP